MKPVLALAVGALMLNGCVTDIPRLPDLSQELLLNNTLTTKQIVIGAIVLYYAKDGLVWEVEDRNIGEDLYRLTVKQGKLKTTGQGEARLYFNRRAEEIASIQQCKGFTTLEYNESLISDFLNVPQRVTEGVIRCDRTVAKR